MRLRRIFGCFGSEGSGNPDGPLIAEEQYAYRLMKAQAETAVLLQQRRPDITMIRQSVFVSKLNLYSAPAASSNSMMAV
jgi:hypothetical protein